MIPDQAHHSVHRSFPFYTMDSILPNPDTYLNHLQPDIAKQLEIIRNVCLAILGVCPAAS